MKPPGVLQLPFIPEAAPVPPPQAGPELDVQYGLPGIQNLICKAWMQQESISINQNLLLFPLLLSWWLFQPAEPSSIHLLTPFPKAALQGWP